MCQCGTSEKERDQSKAKSFGLGDWKSEVAERLLSPTVDQHVVDCE